MYNEFISFVKNIYPGQSAIPLHEPRFIGNEKKYLLDCVDSTFVSSVGKYVDQFEKKVAEFTGAEYAIAAVNGTSALHAALKLVGVLPGEEVITQPLTFIATCNAIKYCGAEPLFVDIDKKTLGLSAHALSEFLEKNTKIVDDVCLNKITGRRIAAVLPMHTFGHPCEIDEIVELCNAYHIQVVEDAAESLGSKFKDNHTGRFGKVGVFSFNGNKIITTGGGGIIITDDEKLAKEAKHITTTAKLSHPYEFVHDQIGYNYRMPNINAAMGCAQLELIDKFLADKKNLANAYKDFFANFSDINFFESETTASPNHWLNAILLKNRDERDQFLKLTNEQGVMTRPVWKLMNELPMFNTSLTLDISNAQYIADRLVNIPSSVRNSNV